MTNNNYPVLITGVSGFVGRNLKEYLHGQNSFQITGASRSAEKISEIQELTSVYSYDQLLQDSSSSYRSYVHLAGKVYDLREKATREEYIKANYELTKKLFDRFCEDPAADKFVFVSTIHVLTENPDGLIEEGYTPIPVTPYGESKQMAERYLFDHCPPDKKVYVLRPGMIHGPGNKGNLNMLYKLIEKGLPYPIGAVNNKRSFVSIENLCFVIREILDREIDPGLYHISDDEPTNTHELVRQIADSLDKKARIWHIPLPLLKLFARIGNVTRFPLNESRLRKLTDDFVITNEKIKKAIGKPLPVTAEEGLRRTLLSFRHENE